MLPDDIIGVLSYDNDNPLNGLKTTALGYYCELVSKNNNTMVFSSLYSAVHPAIYLGALVDKNRTTIYWINESKPLP